MGCILELIRTFDGQKSSSVDFTKINWNQIEDVLREWTKAIQECEREGQYSKVA
ncbi:MAG: hypothetical protein ACYDA4_04685 [Ignavibacteriaceae bacterium]